MTTNNPIPPDVEVLAAIGAWTLHESKGRPDMANEIFDRLLPQFRDRYPHHKLLAHWCQDAKEAIDVTPGAENQPSGDNGMSVSELIQRLKLFRPDARVVVKAQERGFDDIAEIRQQPIAANAGLRPHSIGGGNETYVPAECFCGKHLEPSDEDRESEDAILIKGAG